MIDSTNAINIANSWIIFIATTAVSLLLNKKDKVLQMQIQNINVPVDQEKSKSRLVFKVCAVLMLAVLVYEFMVPWPLTRFALFRVWGASMFIVGSVLYHLADTLVKIASVQEQLIKILHDDKSKTCNKTTE